MVVLVGIDPLPGGTVGVVENAWAEAHPTVWSVCEGDRTMHTTGLDRGGRKGIIGGVVFGASIERLVKVYFQEG